MSDDERSSFDKLPKVLVFDGDAEGYLDADEAYQRWARRHYKGGLDKWPSSYHCSDTASQTTSGRAVCSASSAMKCHETS